MSVNPIDVIAEAINAELDEPRPGLAKAWANVTAKSLTDDRIVDHAVQFLKDDGWTATNDGDPISDDDLRLIARSVLRSVRKDA